MNICVLSQRPNTHDPWNIYCIILRLINTILLHASSSYMSVFVNLTLCRHYCANTLNKGLLHCFTPMSVFKSVTTFRLSVFHVFKCLISRKECQVSVSHFQLFEFIVRKDDKRTIHVSEESSTAEWTSIHAIFFVIQNRPCHIHEFE